MKTKIFVLGLFLFVASGLIFNAISVAAQGPDNGATEAGFSIPNPEIVSCDDPRARTRCNDGTCSTSTGQGTCSSHGGVAGPVDNSSSGPSIEPPSSSLPPSSETESDSQQTVSEPETETQPVIEQPQNTESSPEMPSSELSNSEPTSPAAIPESGAVLNNNRPPDEREVLGGPPEGGTVIGKPRWG